MAVCLRGRRPRIIIARFGVFLSPVQWQGMVSDNPQDLFAQTGALRDEERLLLQLAAIIYEPVSTSFLCRAYMALHQFFLGERRVRYDEISTSLTQLRRQGFLSGQNQCDPVLAELLVRQSIREKRFARLVAFVEQSAPMEYQHGRLQARYWRALRQFRIGLYSQNSQMIEDALAFLAQGECRALAAEMPTLIQILTCALTRPGLPPCRFSCNSSC